MIHQFKLTRRRPRRNPRRIHHLLRLLITVEELMGLLAAAEGGATYSLSNNSLDIHFPDQLPPYRLAVPHSGTPWGVVERGKEEMCSCLGSATPVPREHIQDGHYSLSVSIQLKETTVRLVHAGGRIEMYQNAILASKLLDKYPGMCIAHPTVFKRPHESLLSRDDILLPGNKYFIIRSSTVEKLKRRKSRNGRNRGSEGNVEEVMDSGDMTSGFEDHASSGEYYVPKDKWSVLRKQVAEKKQFVPPIQKPRLRRETEWEPSLTSIQEVSP